MPTGQPDSGTVERDRLLTALTASAADAIFAQDSRGMIQAWNHGAERLYGYTAQEVIGRSGALLMPANRPNEEGEILGRIRNGESVRQLETTRIRKDGSEINVSLSISPICGSEGELLGISQIARDITQRVLVESATAQLAAIVDSSDDAIISKNLDGIILTWNTGAERVYGYSADEVRWRSMSLLLPDDRRGEEEEILARLKRGERVDHFDTVRVRKDGRLIDVSLTISPIRDAAGTVRGASHIARDITAHKLFQNRLLQMQKLESLGIMAGGVAHDFNNLLVGILANSSLLEATLPESHPHREVAGEIAIAAERAAALTRQLLAYAGKGRFVTEPVNLSATVREIQTLVQASIPSKTQVRLELDDHVPPIDGDLGQIQQVLMNLVINAAEASADRAGDVIVSTRLQHVTQQETGDVWADTELSPGPYVVVEVNDNGCGMDFETLEKIFDPFFTTKFAGRGLGLAAVLGIVRGHKGALRVYSVPGQGSNFKVFFPVSSTAVPLPVASAAPADLQGCGTILVVDDEPIVWKAAKLALQRYGYTVLVASSGREAIDLFYSARDEVNLVILDLTMPQMNGEEVLRELQFIKAGVSVLLSSGFNEVEAVRQFTGKGLAGFIQKPYTARALGAKVKQILRSSC